MKEMTVDERLEKLAGRTEAIAQSVDMLIRNHFHNQRRWKEHRARAEERSVKAEERSAKIDERTAQLIGITNRLAHIDRRHL
jgi:hypothetical protein